MSKRGDRRRARQRHDRKKLDPAKSRYLKPLLVVGGRVLRTDWVLGW